MNTTTNLGLTTYSNVNTDIFDPMVVDVPNMQKIDQFAGDVNSDIEELTNTVNSAVETVRDMEDDVETLQTNVNNKPNINNTDTSDKDTYSSRKIQELINELNNLISALTNQLANKQNNITGAATTITTNNLPVGRALVSDANGKIASSQTSSTQLNYLNSVTSNVQTQLNNKADAVRLNWEHLIDLSVSNTSTRYSNDRLATAKEIKLIAHTENIVYDILTLPYHFFSENEGRIMVIESGGNGEYITIGWVSDSAFDYYSVNNTTLSIYIR